MRMIGPDTRCANMLKATSAPTLMCPASTSLAPKNRIAANDSLEISSTACVPVDDRAVTRSDAAL